MIRLEHTIFLYALALIPLLLLLFWMMRRWQRAALKRFGEPLVIGRLFPDVSRSKPVWKFILMMLAFSFLVIGIANPQIGTSLEEVKREGVDLIIALDVSNSMKAEDIKPNRLERAKQAISRLVDQLNNDRIGLIVFAGEAYTQLPLTTDYSAAKLFLSTIDNEIVSTQGTAIGAAIELARKSFNENEKKYKVLMIITDGENHEDDAIGETQKAFSEGIIVHTIGMGSVSGAPIPIYQNGVQVEFRKDQDGSIILTKLDEATLQQIAAAGHGKYVHASNSETGLNTILQEVNTMEKKEYGSKIFTDYEDRFQYFLAAALLLLIGELFISERRSKWLTRWNLFGEKKL